MFPNRSKALERLKIKTRVEELKRMITSNVNKIDVCNSNIISCAKEIGKLESEIGNLYGEE